MTPRQARSTRAMMLSCVIGQWALTVFAFVVTDELRYSWMPWYFAAHAVLYSILGPIVWRQTRCPPSILP